MATCNHPTTVLADLGNIDLIPRHIRMTARTEKEVQLIDTMNTFQLKPKLDSFSNDDTSDDVTKLTTRIAIGKLVALVFSRWVRKYLFCSL